MDYVNESSLDLAKEMEKRFTTLHPTAGVLFIGVRAVPVPGGKSKTFEVRLGIQRKFDEGTGMAIIKKVLEKELLQSSGYTILASVYRGSAGRACDASDEAASKPSA